MLASRWQKENSLLRLWLFQLGPDYYIKRNTWFPTIEPLVTILWMPELPFTSDQHPANTDTRHPEQQNSKGRQLPIFSDTPGTFSKNLYYFLENTNELLKLQGHQSKIACPTSLLQEDRLSCKTDREEHSQSISQSSLLILFSSLKNLMRN